MVQVAFQGLTTEVGEAVFCLRYAAIEIFDAFDVFGFFQFASVHAQVTICGVQDFLQLVEGEGCIDGQGTDDAQAHPFVNQAIQWGAFATQTANDTQSTFGRWSFQVLLLAQGVLLSHHISLR